MRIPLFAPVFAVLLLQSSLLHGQTVEDRITALMSQMTTAEKIDQLHQEGGFNTPDNIRLNVPGFIMADGPHGVRDGYATAFPVGIGMASTWDVDLAQRIGVAMGKEFRGKAKHQALGPCLDIDRDPRNGRSPETGGEDPYLCARITTSVVKGIQTTPCLATVKHYNANHRENGRTVNNIIASQRVLMEPAGLAFRTAVQEGGAFCVMNAYNKINNEWCAENHNLLTTILRESWGFPYYVVSDWGSIVSSERAIKAGCDICMGSTYYQNDLPGLVQTGIVTQAQLDAAVRRVLRTKILSGVLDYYPRGDPADVNSPEHQQLCLEAGRKSLVLLKNQGGILPLDKNAAGTIALIGPSAAVLQIDGSGSAYVTPFYTVTPKQALELKIGASRVAYAKGCDINSTDTTGYADALTAAAVSGTVIYCGGLDGSQEGEGFDRAGGSIDLPGKQQDLIRRLAAVNPNLIVVLFSGGVCGIDNSLQSMKALIYAFYPGQEGGQALADVLFGDYNPGGKMPVTMPKTVAQLPAWNDNLNDDYGCGYRWFDKQGITPQFAFGSGLSYTTFSYSNLQITPTTTTIGQPVTVSVDVRNSGLREGEEVVQFYLADSSAPVPKPVKELKGFRRVMLAPGQTSRVSITLTADELYYFDETDSSYHVHPGSYTVRVGGASDNLPLAGIFQLNDAPTRPDLQLMHIRMMPRYPVQGDSVVFLATVKNAGTGASPAGVSHKVLFAVNGTPMTWSDDATASIPAGGMALVCANAGVFGKNFWRADSLGTFTVQASVDPDGAMEETIENNNTLVVEGMVVPPPPVNLALRKSVTVSSVESAQYPGSNAVDGNEGTRWSSAFSDPQSITVDLGAMYHVEKIVLTWEAAFGKEYWIQCSENGTTWVNVKYETNGDGAIDVIPASINARFVRMLGAKRGTIYGYSLYELEVYGSDVTTGVIEQVAGAAPTRFFLDQNFPNPFNPSTTISYAVAQERDVNIAIYNTLGQLVTTLAEGPQRAGNYTVTWNGRDQHGRDVSSGMYLCRMISGGFSDVRRMLLLR